MITIEPVPRLRSARLRGVRAPEALEELLGAAVEGRGGGSVVEPVVCGAVSLDALEELSGRS
ncbi:hypothetical protein ACFXPI_13290 [Streptomyces sp. NPDC059104]|uniref:hypothetical protein n=1 Tax=Streptomyces sp. NPDC059104 TaxID=3346729 RepID=UPI0036B64607